MGDHSLKPIPIYPLNSFNKHAKKDPIVGCSILTINGHVQKYHEDSVKCPSEPILSSTEP